MSLNLEQKQAVVAEISAQVEHEASTHTHATTIATAKFCAQTWPKAVLGDFAALERGSAELVAYCTDKHVEQIRLLANMHLTYARAMREPMAENIAAFWGLSATRVERHSHA